MVLPLNDFHIASARDREEGENILTNEMTNSRIISTDNDRPFKMDVYSVDLGCSQLTYINFGSRLDVASGVTGDEVFLNLGLPAGSSVTMNDETCLSKGQGVVINAGVDLGQTRQRNTGELVLKLSTKAIHRHLQSILGRPLGKQIKFDTEVSMNSGEGRQASSAANFVVESLASNKDVLDNPLIKNSFDDMLVNALLSLPSNYYHELNDDGCEGYVSSLVKRAEEFIESHSMAAVTITDVLKECKCDRKTLFANFRRYRSYTPQQFLMEARLRSANQILNNPAFGESVTSIAYSCGFLHMGRFSKNYFERFGELPSHTLKKSS